MDFFFGKKGRKTAEIRLWRVRHLPRIFHGTTGRGAKRLSQDLSVTLAQFLKGKKKKQRTMKAGGAFWTGRLKGSYRFVFRLEAPL